MFSALILMGQHFALAPYNKYGEFNPIFAIRILDVSSIKMNFFHSFWIYHPTSWKNSISISFVTQSADSYVVNSWSTIIV